MLNKSVYPTDLLSIASICQLIGLGKPGGVRRRFETLSVGFRNDIIVTQEETPMSRTLHILLLEDCHNDARLILDELRRAGFTADWANASRPRSTLSPSLTRSWTSSCSTTMCPSSTALRALGLVRDRGLNVPVIMITGALGDEAAVECLKQGAADYLLKDRLARLGQAVMRVLDQTEALARQRRAEQSLRDSEARKTAILETAVDAIITIDDRGLVESVNPATERIFGYAADVMVGQNINLLMPYPDRGDHDRYLDDYLDDRAQKLLGIGRELIGRRNDGSRFPVELTVCEDPAR